MWKLIKMKHAYGKLHPGFSRITEISNIFLMTHITIATLGIKPLDFSFRKCDPNEYLQLFRLKAHWILLCYIVSEHEKAFGNSQKQRDKNGEKSFSEDVNQELFLYGAGYLVYLQVFAQHQTITSYLQIIFYINFIFPAWISVYIGYNSLRIC